MTEGNSGESSVGKGGSLGSYIDGEGRGWCYRASSPGKHTSCWEKCRQYSWGQYWQGSKGKQDRTEGHVELQSGSNKERPRPNPQGEVKL